MNKNRKPSWWLLNSLMIGMISVLFFTQRLFIAARPVSQIGIVVFGYWLVWRWLTANAAALEDEKRQKQKDAEPDLREGSPACFEGKTLNPQQIHYLRIGKSNRTKSL